MMDIYFDGTFLVQLETNELTLRRLGHYNHRVANLINFQHETLHMSSLFNSWCMGIPHNNYTHLDI